MRKLIYGLLVAAGALVFSAYTNAQQEYEFYRVSGPEDSTNPEDYEYQPGSSCLSSADNCKVTEILSTPPQEEDNPSASAMANIQTGTPVIN